MAVFLSLSPQDHQNINLTHSETSTTSTGLNLRNTTLRDCLFHNALLHALLYLECPLVSKHCVLEQIKRLIWVWITSGQASVYCQSFTNMFLTVGFILAWLSCSRKRKSCQMSRLCCSYNKD